MNCRQAMRAIHARLENQPVENPEALNQHLASCLRCRAESGQLEELTELLNASRVQVSPPPAMADQIWATICERQEPVAQPRAPWTSWLGWRYSLAGTAAAALALMMGSFFLHPGAPTSNGNSTLARVPKAVTESLAKVTPAKIAPAPRPRISDEGISSGELRPLRPAPKPVVTPHRPRRLRLMYYARMLKPMADVASYPAAETHHPLVTEPTRKDYERVALCLDIAHDRQQEASIQVKEELEKTANVLSLAVGMMKKAVEEPVPESVPQPSGTGTSGAPMRGIS